MQEVAVGANRHALFGHHVEFDLDRRVAVVSRLPADLRWRADRHSVDVRVCCQHVGHARVDSDADRARVRLAAGNQFKLRIGANRRYMLINCNLAEVDQTDLQELARICLNKKAKITVKYS